MGNSPPAAVYKASYYHFDGLGSVIVLTDSAGNVVESYRYTVYGQADKISAYGNPYLFTGRKFDIETGLYYYRARYYSAAIGKFLGLISTRKHFSNNEWYR
ncbi:MAG: RHS repeat-associated core domain-containing protein [Sedimentisphaerales bacterium]